MQRRLHVSLVVAAALSSLALGTGTAFADDGGPVNVNNDGGNSDHAKHDVKPKIELPEFGHMGGFGN
ncbi:MAG TPA: hypothetical protein VFE65_22910 [Pseudonocardia sp.]|jgi:hypothetical protein|nr:hypothetical protein [Pseudonocardia sp.]